MYIYHFCRLLGKKEGRGDGGKIGCEGRERGKGMGEGTMRGRRGRREEGEHPILLGMLDKYSTASVTVGMHFMGSVEKVQDNVFVPDLL